jgi:hypothetical protein
MFDGGAIGAAFAISTLTLTGDGTYSASATVGVTKQNAQT